MMSKGHRKLVGKRVRLLVDVHTQGGEVFTAGTEFMIKGTWRGRFNLTGHDGHVYRVHRDRFEVLKEKS